MKTKPYAPTACKTTGLAKSRPAIFMTKVSSSSVGCWPWKVWGHQRSIEQFEDPSFPRSDTTNALLSWRSKLRTSDRSNEPLPLSLFHACCNHTGQQHPKKIDCWCRAVATNIRPSVSRWGTSKRSKISRTVSFLCSCATFCASSP